MEFLIATILSCESAEDIISRIPSNENRAELVQQVKMNTEEGCFEDAQVDWRNGAKIPTTLEKPNGKSHL